MGNVTFLFENMFSDALEVKQYVTSHDLKSESSLLAFSVVMKTSIQKFYSNVYIFYPTYIGFPYPKIYFFVPVI